MKLTVCGGTGKHSFVTNESAGTGRRDTRMTAWLDTFSEIFTPNILAIPRIILVPTAGLRRQHRWVVPNPRHPGPRDTHLGVDEQFSSR